MAAETLEALSAARTEGRPTYLLTSLDGERRRLTATEADALGERAALAVAHGRPTVIGEAVLDPILPPLHLVVCGAGPDAGPLVAAAIRQGWRVDVVDPRRSWLRPDRFPGARLLDVEAAEAAEASGAGEFTAVVVMSHDYLRDAAFVGGFLGRGRHVSRHPRPAGSHRASDGGAAVTAVDRGPCRPPCAGRARHRCRRGRAGRRVDRRRDPGRAPWPSGGRLRDRPGPIHS